MEVYNQISELEARANSLDNEKSNLHQSASNEINALKVAHKNNLGFIALIILGRSFRTF